MNDTIKIGACILVGGASSRMGQPKEKLYIKAGGENGEKLTFLEKLKSELSSFSSLYISGKGFIEDIYKGIGPLGGICSVLKAAAEPAVLFVACDMPFFSCEAAAYLCERWKGEAAFISVLREKREPLAAIYTKECIPFIEKQIESGNYRISDLFDKVKTGFAEMSDFESALTNINTPEDYSALMRNEDR